MNHIENSNSNRGIPAEPTPNPLKTRSVVERPSLVSQPTTKRNIHLNLTINDRLVFYAVQDTMSGITALSLSRITRLPWNELQSSIAVLQSTGLVAKTDDNESRYYAVPSRSTEPLYGDWESLLSSFWESYPPKIDDDLLGTAYLSCGAVLLTALISGSSDEHLIARTAVLPTEFAMLVLEMAERENVWWCESIYELRRVLEIQPTNFFELEMRLREATEDLWELCWTPEIHNLLQVYRAGHS
jgi:hypothetical protein